MIHPGQIRLGEISILTEWSCPATVGVGDTVYQTGANSVDKADYTSILTMPCVGVVASKPSSTACLVTRQGLVNGYPPASFTPKETLFVGVAGGLVNAAGLPSTPGTVVHEVGFAKTDRDLLVTLDRDYTIL